MVAVVPKVFHSRLVAVADREADDRAASRSTWEATEMAAKITSITNLFQMNTSFLN